MRWEAPAVKLGEEWAYRERSGTQAVRVRVTRVGKVQPNRVRVRFVDDHYEGREDWVPISRLKVPWDGVSRWQAREDRWQAVQNASRTALDSPEYWAADLVFAALPEGELTLGWAGKAGVLMVRDLGALTARLGLSIEDVRTTALAFIDDDGTFVAPWAVAESVARLAAPLVAEEVLEDVARRQARARHRAIYGERQGNGYYTSPETCAEVDRTWQRSYEVVRDWCGAEAVQRHDDLALLRAELLRVGQIAERAIRELDAAGATRLAANLSRQLRSDDPGVSGDRAKPRSSGGGLASDGHRTRFAEELRGQL